MSTDFFPYMHVLPFDFLSSYFVVQDYLSRVFISLFISCFIISKRKRSCASGCGCHEHLSVFMYYGILSLTRFLPFPVPVVVCSLDCNIKTKLLSNVKCYSFICARILLAWWQRFRTRNTPILKSERK